MFSAVSSSDRGGVLIFFYFCSKHRCWGKSGGGGSHTWLFSQHFMLCSDVNIVKLSLVILVKPRVSPYRHYKVSFEYEEN